MKTDKAVCTCLTTNDFCVFPTPIGASSDPDPSLRRGVLRYPVSPPHHPESSPMNNDQPSNNQYAANLTFGKQRVLNHVPRDAEQEARALRYLDKHAPDLVGVIMGGVL